jgi:hypothetical protein
MTRRTLALILPLALGLLVAPLVGEGQLPKPVRIGYLSANPPADRVSGSNHAKTYGKRSLLATRL